MSYLCKMCVVIPCCSSESGQKASHLDTTHIVLVKCRVSGHSSLTQIHILHLNQVMHQAVKSQESNELLVITDAHAELLQG